MDEPRPPDVEDILAELHDDARGRVKEELLPGERLLWAARSHPDPFRPGGAVFAFLLMASFAVGSLAALRFAFSTERFGNTPPDSLVTIGILSGIAAAIAGLVLVGILKGTLNKRWARSQHLYAITDRRAILRTPTFDRMGIEVRAIDLNSIGNIHRTEYPDGLGTLSVSIEGATTKVLDPEHGGLYDTAESYRMEKIPEIRRVELLLRRAVADRRDHRDQAPPEGFRHAQTRT